MNAPSSSAQMYMELYSSWSSLGRMMLRLERRRVSTNDANVMEIGARWKSGIFCTMCRASDMVRDLPTPGCPTRNANRFGNSGREVVTQTFCSSTADIVVIAAHLRKISGAWRFLVSATNDSIQDSNLRLPLPAVVPGVIFEPVRIFIGVAIIVVALIPAYFAIVWDS